MLIRPLMILAPVLFGLAEFPPIQPVERSAAFALEAPAPGPESAVEATCGWCDSQALVWGWQHYFYGSSGCTGGGANGCFDCNAFNACHTNIQLGTCLNYHYGCGGGGGEETMGLPLDNEFFRMVAAAASSGLGASVTTITTKLHGVVELNEQRMALQVLNCRGEAIANFPLGSGGLAARVDD